ncbi:MAG: membrane protein insertase YidC [Candidatus Omnitrophica bacterium]|nr:membrane protein insertase YidC [Candidatus Omnitrophota bacterium]
MDKKRFILAIVLTVAFLFGYQYFLGKYYPADSGQETQESPALSSSADTPPQETRTEPKDAKRVALPPAEESAQEHQTEIGGFFITYSAKGGYIKSAVVSEKGDQLDYRTVGYVPEQADVRYQVREESSALVFTAPSGATKTFRIEGYVITLEFSSPPSSVVFFSVPPATDMLNQRYQNFFYSREEKIKRIHVKKVKPETLRDIEFAGVRDRYYCISLLPGDYVLKTESTEDRELVVHVNSPGEHLAFFMGPQHTRDLAAVGLKDIVSYGFFHWIAVIIHKLLLFFYSFTHSWGLSIILLAVAIYLCLFPFTRKSTQAMKKMQQLQPQQQALKEKYKDNPQKLNKEMLELFRKNKVNPLGGCLPLFFQLPVFLALYQILLRFAELKGAEFLWIQDLSRPDRLAELPMSLPFLGGHFNLLPVLIMAVGFIQQKITAKNVTAPEQKTMGLVFSVMIGVIFYNFPAAIVLYWLVQNILTLSYQTLSARSS